MFKVMIKAFDGTQTLVQGMKGSHWVQNIHNVTWAHYDTRDEAEEAAADMRRGQSRQVLSVWVEEAVR